MNLLSFRDKRSLFNNRWPQHVNVGTYITSYTWRHITYAMSHHIRDVLASSRHGQGDCNAFHRHLIKTYFLEIVSYASDAGNVCEIGCLRNAVTAVCYPQDIGWGQLSNMLPFQSGYDRRRLIGGYQRFRGTWLRARVTIRKHVTPITSLNFVRSLFIKYCNTVFAERIS